MFKALKLAVKHMCAFHSCRLTMVIPITTRILHLRDTNGCLKDKVLK